MAKRHKELLGALDVSRAKPKAKPYRLADGGRRGAISNWPIANVYDKETPANAGVRKHLDPSETPALQYLGRRYLDWSGLSKSSPPPLTE